MVEVERKRHSGWDKELRPVVGKWQWFFRNDYGTISMIKLLNGFHSEEWEIYGLKGNLFDGPLRFPERHMAIRKAKQILEGQSTLYSID